MKKFILFWLLCCWLLATLLMFSITGCETEPNCEEVDCEQCWQSWWIYDPILRRWIQVYRPCEEEI